MANDDAVIDRIERMLQPNDSAQYDLVLTKMDEARATLRDTHRLVLRARGVSLALYQHRSLAEIDALFSQFNAAFDKVAEQWAKELRPWESGK